MKSLSLSKPHALIMVGLPGSGKSFFAHQFADTFSAPYVSVDTILEITGTSHEAAVTLVHHQLTEIMKTKSSLIVEASTYSRADRTELTKLCRNHGYEPLLVWVQVDELAARARSLKAKPYRSANDHDKIAKRFSPPHATEKPVVISGKHTYATQAKIVLKRLSLPRAEISMHASAPVRSIADIRRSKS